MVTSSPQPSHRSRLPGTRGPLIARLRGLYAVLSLAGPFGGNGSVLLFGGQVVVLECLRGPPGVQVRMKPGMVVVGWASHCRFRTLVWCP